MTETLGPDSHQRAINTTALYMMILPVYVNKKDKSSIIFGTLGKEHNPDDWRETTATDHALAIAKYDSPAYRLAACAKGTVLCGQDKFCAYQVWESLRLNNALPSPFGKDDVIPVEWYNSHVHFEQTGDIYKRVIVLNGQAIGHVAWCDSVTRGGWGGQPVDKGGWGVWLDNPPTLYGKRIHHNAQTLDGVAKWILDPIHGLIMGKPDKKHLTLDDSCDRVSA